MRPTIGNSAAIARPRRGSGRQDAALYGSQDGCRYEIRATRDDFGRYWFMGSAPLETKRPGPRRCGPACQTFRSLRYFLGAAGAFVAGGEDMSPLSLQATKKLALINAKNRHV